MSNPKATSGSLSQHLSSLPNLDKTHFVSTYVRDQKVHAKSYVLEDRDYCVASIGDEVQAHNAFGTPVLKPRRQAKIILETAPSPLNDHMNDLPKALIEDRLDHRTPKENKRKRPGSAGVAKRSVPKFGQHKPPLKNDLDVKDEQAWRRERRDRKRAKRTIINPTRSSNVENETASDAKATRKANTRPRIPAGFALMQGFTATNVGASRLTIKPTASIGVFNKGKASAKALAKSAKKVRQSIGFSELGFLNKAGQEQCKLTEKHTPIHLLSDTDSRSRSSDQSPEEQPEKFVITNRRPLKARQSVTKKRTPRSLPGNENKSVMSVDRLSICHSTQARSSSDALPKATLAESTVWDIEIHTASLLSPALSSKKHNAVLEIRNRPWNDSPTVELAVPDDSQDKAASFPSSETPPDKSDNFIEEKSSSPSLGPSQSASQHRWSFPPTYDTRPPEGVNSKYFNPQIVQDEQQPSLEIQPFNSVSVFLSKQGAKIPPASRLDSSPNRPSDLVFLVDTYNLTSHLDKQVTQHSLASDHRPDPESSPCSQPGPTRQTTSSSWQPVSDVNIEEVGPDNRVDSELIDHGCTSWWGSEHSVDNYTHDRHPWLSVDYDGDCDPLEHHGCDVPEEFVSRHSHVAYDAREDLYHDYSGSGETNAIISAYDEAEHSDEHMIDLAFTFSDNGDHQLVEGHVAGCDLCPDSDSDRDYGEEYFGDEHETLELDHPCKILDGESHVALRNRGTTPSIDLDNSSFSDTEPISTALFSQGRMLLLGSTQEDGDMTTAVRTRSPSCRPLLSLVEADVARSLRNHWLPQKL